MRIDVHHHLFAPAYIDGYAIFVGT